jgi:hypothetical protein
MEVTAAVLVLVIGTAAVMSGFANLVGVRRDNDSLCTINALLAELDNRIQGAHPDDLLADSGWLRPRPALLPGNSIVTITADNQPLDEAALRATGLLDRPSRIHQLRIYIEFYRGMRTVSEPISGVERLDTDPANTTPVARPHLFSDPPITDWSGVFRYPPHSLTNAGTPASAADAFLVPRDNGNFTTLASLNRDADWQLVVRLIAVWQEQSGQTIDGLRYKEIITGRRIPRRD